MIEVKTVVSGDATIRKIIGHPTFDEILRILKDFYSGTPTRHVIWDLSAASLEKLKIDDLDRLGDFVMKYAHLREGGKTAFIASRDLEYGLGRTIDSLAESKNSPITTHTFRSFREAAEWIGVDIKDFE